MQNEIFTQILIYLGSTNITIMNTARDVKNKNKLHERNNGKDEYYQTREHWKNEQSPGGKNGDNWKKANQTCTNESR